MTVQIAKSSIRTATTWSGESTSAVYGSGLIGLDDVPSTHHVWDIISRHGSRARERTRSSDATYSYWRRSTSLETATSAFEELNRVVQESKLAGWDGYGAVPVSPETIGVAREFLDSLPLGFTSPSVSAAPDGSVVLEWYSDQSHLLLVCICESRVISYAFLSGSVTTHGTEPFFGNIPSIIISLIGKIRRTK